MAKYKTEQNDENYDHARTLVEVDGLTAAAAAWKLGLNDRTVQDWARKDGWDKTAINARRRAKRAQKRSASTERSATPSPVRRPPPHSNGAQISKPTPPPLPPILELPRPVFSHKNPSRTTVPPNTPNAYQCSTCRDQFNLFQWHPNKHICPEALKRYRRA